MLPTLIRSGGVGAFSTFSRCGALVAPFVPLLESIFTFLPLLLFGVVAFTAGLLASTLPETLGMKLPDSIEEAENVGKKRRSIDDEDTWLSLDWTGVEIIWFLEFSHQFSSFWKLNMFSSVSQSTNVQLFIVLTGTWVFPEVDLWLKFDTKKLNASRK